MQLKQVSKNKDRDWKMESYTAQTLMTKKPLHLSAQSFFSKSQLWAFALLVVALAGSTIHALVLPARTNNISFLRLHIEAIWHLAASHCFLFMCFHIGSLHIAHTCLFIISSLIGSRFMTLITYLLFCVKLFYQLFDLAHLAHLIHFPHWIML